MLIAAEATSAPPSGHARGERDGAAVAARSGCDEDGNSSNRARRCPARRGSARCPARGRTRRRAVYERARLVDIHGAPLRAARARRRDELRVPVSVRRRRRASCCKLARPVAGAGDACGARTASTYAWNGGVGPARAIVAFSAICAHKLAYPTRDISFIRYQPQKLGDLRRARDPLLRRPQRLRSGRGRAGRRGTGAAAARGDPARLRCGDGRARTRSAPSAPSSSTLLREVRVQARAGIRARQGAARRSAARPSCASSSQYCRQTMQC